MPRRHRASKQLRDRVIPSCDLVARATAQQQQRPPKPVAGIGHPLANGLPARHASTNRPERTNAQLRRDYHPPGVLAGPAAAGMRGPTCGPPPVARRPCLAMQVSGPHGCGSRSSFFFHTVRRYLQERHPPITRVTLELKTRVAREKRAVRESRFIPSQLQNAATDLT